MSAKLRSKAQQRKQTTSLLRRSLLMRCRFALPYRWFRLHLRHYYVIVQATRLR